MYQELTKSPDRAVAAQSYLRLGQGYRRLGDPQAKPALERALEFKDQPDVVAKARAALGTGAGKGTAAAAAGSPGATMRRLWEGPEVDISGSISPDGRLLSFVDWSTGDLALRDLTNDTSRRLTNKGRWEQSGEYAERHVYSRDGRFIAYSWYGGSDAAGYEIRIIDLQAPTGSAPRRLVPGSAPVRWCMPHDWSPDGKWLLVSVTAARSTDSTAPRGTDSLVLLDVRASTVAKTLATHEVDAARFSADGSVVAFDRRRPDNLTSDIVVAGIEDSRESTVGVGAGLNAPLAWTPEGHLLFSNTRKSRPGVWLQRMGGRTSKGEPTLVKADLWSRGLGMTAAGGLALATRVSNQEIHFAEFDAEAGRVRPGSVRTLDVLIGNLLHPAASPDGTSLVYIARRDEGGQPTLGILDTRTDAVRQVRVELRNFRRPRWAPDGRSIVAQGASFDERQGLFRIDVETGAVTPLVMSSVPAESLSAPEWSPDGNLLYYIRTLRPAGVQSCSIVARDMRSGQEREVTKCGGFGRFSLSPDGTRVAQLLMTGSSNNFAELHVSPVAGGDSREIYRVVEDGSLDSVSWMPDGRHVIVVRSKPGPTTQRETLLVPAGGGAPKVLDLPTTVSERIDVSSDGKRMAFVAGERRQEVWLLENYLTAPTTASTKK
jgi:Tol biopolymer transport system component